MIRISTDLIICRVFAGIDTGQTRLGISDYKLLIISCIIIYFRFTKILKNPLFCRLQRDIFIYTFKNKNYSSYLCPG